MTLRERVLYTAQGWIGTPYQHQASLKGVGCDCLGLLRGVWREIYGFEPEALPGYSRDWAEALGQETLAEAAGRHMIPVAVKECAPGDVILFSIAPNTPSKHCAIITAPGRMIHAYENHPVADVTMGPWWQRRIRFAFAFPEIT